MLQWTVTTVKGGPERAGHPVVAVGHQLYSFGVSYAEDLDQVDVRVFNTVSLCWSTLPPAVTTERGGGRPPEVPSMRRGHTAALLDGVIYVWGGFSFLYTPHRVELGSELYAFDVRTHRWFEPKVSGTAPGARYNHSACVLGKVMYIYGGYNRVTGFCNDMYKLDTATMVWSVVNTRGTPPPALQCHSATIIGTKMFIFGGKGNQGDYYNNIRVFDTETDSWLSAEPSSAQLLPEGRSGHSAFAYNGELHIIGGNDFHRTFDDLCKFNPETSSWDKVTPPGNGPCRMSEMCCCMAGDRIILFGGHRCNDLYIVDLNPSLKMFCKLAVIRYGLEHSGLPRAIRWELAAMSTDSNTKKYMSMRFTYLLVLAVRATRWMFRTLKRG